MAIYNLKPKESVDIPSFIGVLFQYRDKIHLAHLKTTSYASHMALNSLYEGLLDIIDTLVETAQTDSILSITIPQSDTKEVNENVAQELLDYVRTNRNIFPHSFQQNEIDTLEALLSSTIYKLKFLK